MRKVFLLIKAAAALAVFLLLLGLAIKNLDSVTVRYFLGYEWQAPLVIVLLAFFASGMVLGMVPTLAILVRQRRQIVGLKRDLRGATRAAAAPLLAESA